MYRITVLGGGMVGGVIAKDLARDAENVVRVVDNDPEALARLKASTPLETLEADLTKQESIIKAVKDSDIVVGAVPGWMGMKTLETVAEAGIDMVDISFMPEDPRRINSMAVERGVRIVVDCGVAPGISNMVLGRMKASMDSLEEARIYVGGLPVVRTWPYEYKAGFSPVDVMEEYTRPARIMMDGREETVPALSDVEPLQIPGVGTLEAFNTDGLRTLLDTIPCPNMVEKTLRYPGHAEKMRMLRETGFFSQDPVCVKGQMVKPLDVTTKILLPMWKLAEGEEEMTVMRITVKGMVGRVRRIHTYDLLERTHKGITSMARTTAFPASVVCRLMLRGEIQNKGVIVPETLGEDERIFERVMAGLMDRDICLKHTVEEQ